VLRHHLPVLATCAGPAAGGFGENPMSTDMTAEFQKQAEELLRAQQEAYIAAVKAWRDAVAAAAAAGVPLPTSPEPTPLGVLPTPSEVADASYAFAAKMLAEQSRFLSALSAAMSTPAKKR
jgi:hypothetical protein